MTDEPENTDPQPSAEEFDEQASHAMDTRVWFILNNEKATAAEIREARQWIKERRMSEADPETDLQRAVREGAQARAIAAAGAIPPVDAESDDPAARDA